MEGPQIRPLQVILLCFALRLGSKRSTLRIVELPNRTRPTPEFTHCKTKTARCRSMQRAVFLAGRDDRRCTFLNDLTGTGLFQLAIAQVQEFAADTFFALGAADA